MQDTNSYFTLWYLLKSQISTEIFKIDVKVWPQ